jgi:very-short-patch-repair endonuclease
MVEVARTLRKTMTPAETRLWAVLRNRNCGGYRFSRQVPAGHFVLDFYCATAWLCVEVDGGIHADQKVRQYDRGRESVLRDELKINVLRLTNDEVLKSTSEALTGKLIGAIQEAAKGVAASGERPARFPTRTR